MDFKEYDKKIKEELEAFEKMEWEVYYRTLLPDFLQEYADNYDGNPEDKERAVKDYETTLIARHMPRVQRLLDKKREKLTIKYLGELNERLEAAQHEADQEDDEPEYSCKERQTLTSKIIADQASEIEKLKAELQDKQENLDICTGLTDRYMYRQRIVECAFKLKDEKLLKDAYAYMSKLSEEGRSVNYA